MPFDNNEQEIRLTERFARHARDFDDLQNEMAGRDVGRISRFLSADAQDAKEPEKREERKAAMLSALQAALTDLVYAVLFEDTQKALADAQSRLDTLAQRVASEIVRSEAALEEKLDRAASLPDGTKVFKDRNGDVRTQDGTMVSAELAATILWHGDEPSFEDIRAGQAEIGDMQSAMEDEDNPPSADELEDVGQRGREIADSLEEELENTLSVSAPDSENNQIAGRTSAPIIVREL